MKSPAEAVVEISNPYLRQKIKLDMSDPWHPKRTSETGEVEEAGSNHEVWVDFAWDGPGEGDFFHPFNTLAAATAAVADGGVVKIMPGSTPERLSLARNKRFRLDAPIGGVSIWRSLTILEFSSTISIVQSPAHNTGRTRDLSISSPSSRWCTARSLCPRTSCRLPCFPSTATAPNSRRR